MLSELLFVLDPGDDFGREERKRGLQPIFGADNTSRFVTQ